MKTLLAAPTLSRITFLMTLVAIGFTFQGCGYFTREDANFSKDVKVPLDFPAFDADALCPSTNEACNQEPVAAPEERTLEPIDVIAVVAQHLSKWLSGLFEVVADSIWGWALEGPREEDMPLYF